MALCSIQLSYAGKYKRWPGDRIRTCDTKSPNVDKVAACSFNKLQFIQSFALPLGYPGQI